jgi:hypothetical protein
MEDKPLTTEDLYGASKPVQTPVTEVAPELKYEETPIIDPVNTTTNSPDLTATKDMHVQGEPSSQTSETPKLSPPHSLPRMPSDSQSGISRSHTGLNILAFILLFVAGIWLSSAIRPYLPSGLILTSQLSASL